MDYVYGASCEVTIIEAVSVIVVIIIILMAFACTDDNVNLIRQIVVKYSARRRNVRFESGPLPRFIRTNARPTMPPPPTILNVDSLPSMNHESRMPGSPEIRIVERVVIQERSEAPPSYNAAVASADPPKYHK
uniref:Uncharacterized protein n=1 Tax=Panagrellus redivivus TaxID=6233 RepID=A0A7E4ZUT3_PANRE